MWRGKNAIEGLRQEAPRSFEDLLRRVRRRRRLRMAVDVALATAAVAAALAVIARAAGVDRIGSLDAAAVIAVAAAAAFALGLAWIVLRAFGLPEAARFSDAQLHLSERLSSALEVRSRPNLSAGPVARALLHDVGERSARIEDRNLGPLFGRSTLAGAAALIACLSALWLLPAADTAPGSPSVAQQAAPGAAAEEAGPDARFEEIARMAELVAADAEARDDAYLAAIANSLRKLAAEASDLPREAIEERLAALAGQAMRGYGDTPPDWLPRDAGDLAGLGSRMADFEQRMEEAARRAEIGAPAQSPQDFCADEGVGECEIDVGARERMLNPPPPGGAGPEADAAAFDIAGLSPDALADMDAARSGEFKAEPLQPQPVAAAPVGAASRSGRGESELAGGGSQDMRGDTRFFDQAGLVGEDVVLAARETGTGNRIRIQVDPETSFSEVTSVEADGAGAWQAQASTPVVRQHIGADARDVVGRYFARAGPSSAEF